MKIHRSPSLPATIATASLLILFGAILLTGCVTESRAKHYLDKHPKAAAKYCAVAFPVTEKRDSVYIVDTTRRKSVEDSLTQYADSLIDILEEDQTPKPGKPCPTYNIDSLRRAITAQIKRYARPCGDTTKVVTVEKVNTAQLEVANGVIGDLQAELARKDQTITQRDERIGVLERRLDRRSKWNTWLWIVVIILGAYTTRKLWMPGLLKLF